MTLDASYRERGGVSNSLIVQALGHHGQRLELPVRERGERRRIRSEALLYERPGYLRIDHGAAGNDGLHGSAQLVWVVDVLLEQVCPTSRPISEEGEDVLCSEMLAQDDYTNLGVSPSQSRSRPDPLVGVRWGHPNVGQYGVGVQGFDLLQQGNKIGTGAGQLYARSGFDDGREPPPYDEVVLGEHDPD